MKREDERKMNNFFSLTEISSKCEHIYTFFFSVFTFLFEEHVRDCDQTSGPFLCSHAQTLIC